MIFLVTAYRTDVSRRNPHNYIVGSWSKKDDAIEAANDHCQYRAGKYDCIVERVAHNQPHDEGQVSMGPIHWALGRKL